VAFIRSAADRVRVGSGKPLANEGDRVDHV
jgi:hypothetical protein